MEQKEIKYLADPATSGLNADDADFSLGQNQVVNAENVRWGSTDAGVVNVVESVGSTLLLSAPQPSVSFITIGSVADTARNRIFYFQCDKYANNHKIVCYDVDANQFYDVLLSSQVTGGLTFNKDYPIHSAKVIGDLLYWTDNYNEPRRINTEAAIKLNNPSYNTDVDAYTAPLVQSVITIIRRAPGRQLSLTFSTDPGRENFIKEFAGQFAIRYVYRDGEVSPFSPPSQFVNYRYDYGTFSGSNSDTTNKISMEINTPALDGEYIEQDVQIVQYAVRFDNQPQYFIIKEWNKDNPDDLAEINAYNAGGALSFGFYNDKVGVACDVVSSIKESGGVPNLSETIEFSNRRLFLGNNVIGYDAPSETSLTATVSPSAVTGTATKILKSFSSYQVGIRFRDNYKRQCSVITNNDLVVEIPDRGDYNDNTLYENINWALSNTNALTEIPDWAYYYDILVTKNLRTRFFVQWMPGSIRYVKKISDGTYTYQPNYPTGGTGLYAIAFDVSTLPTNFSIIQNSGDLIRLYTDGLSLQPFSLEVIGQDANYIFVRPIDLGNLNLFSFFLVEYYTPYKQSGNEPFYTTGIGYRVNNPGTDLRQYSTTSGIIQGDVFFTSRVIFGTTYYSESQSPNDNLWKNYYGFYGEVNIESSLGRVHKKNSVKWSDVFTQGTQNNGLSSFDALDEKLLPQEMGALKKLQNTSKIEAQGGVMLAICEDETASMYLGEVQTYGSDKRPDQVLAVDNIIGTVNVLKGSFGTQNPESVTEYRGSVFWFDAQNGRIIQYGGNGLFPISNYKMTRFWKQFSDLYNSMTASEIEALGDRPFIYMTVDPYHDELLVSIPKLTNTPPKGYLPDYPSTIYPFDIWDGQGKTLVFDLKPEPNRWLGAYTFVTENFVTLQNKLYSFKNGQLYEHNQTTSFNEFYGTQNKSKVMFVSNQQPNQLKVYNNISIQNNTGNLFPSLTYFYVDNPYQQASDLVDFDWTNYEGVHYATLYRNKLVPTATGFDTNGLLTAEKIRTNALKVMLQYDITTVPLQLRIVTLGYILSKGHNQVKLK